MVVGADLETLWRVSSRQANCAGSLRGSTVADMEQGTFWTAAEEWGENGKQDEYDGHPINSQETHTTMK